MKFSRRSTKLLSLVLTSFALLFAAPQANAAWGELDTSFAAPTGYTQFLPAGVVDGYLNSVLVQSDGKIIAAGRGGADFATANPMIQRFLPDGTPDSTYGTGGTLTIPSPAAFTAKTISSAALQPDGKLVAVAKDALGSVLFRVTTSGTLDTTFASPDGYVALPDDISKSVMIHSSGDIYIAGNKDTDGRPVLRRFTSSGTEVGTFRTTSNSNLSSTSFAENQDVLLLQHGAGILLITAGGAPGDSNFFAGKLDTTGSLDSAWGSGGKTTVSFSTTAKPLGALVQPSGALVIGGATDTMGDNAWLLTRLDPNGVLDTTFAGGGKQELSYSTGGEETTSLSALPGGGFVAAGFVEDTVSDKYVGAIRVMDVNGTPDVSFGPNGYRTLPLAGRSVSFQHVAAQPNGRIIATGSSNASSTPTVPLTARFDDPTVTAPKSKISTPTKSKIAAKKLTRFTGSASTNDGVVSKVEIALQRVDSKLLKKSKRCLWLSSNKAKFKKVKAVNKKCSAPKWLKAKGASKWSYKLSKKLPKGNYALSVRATASDGTVQAKPATKKFKIT